MLESRAQPLIGILGSGQLAKMLGQAALQLGVAVKALSRENTPPALWPFPVVRGDWNDPAALIDFAQGTTVITLENEFIEADALAVLEASGHPLLPSASCLARVQDKWIQKQTLAAAGLPVAAFRAVESPDKIMEAATAFGWPLVLKRRKLGYDGKGNATIRSAADIAGAWDRLGGGSHALYVEQYCPFEQELAVMITRAIDGRSVAYPVVQTVQRDHICHTVQAPAALSAAEAKQAADIAMRAAAAIGGVGTIGVELFRLRDSSIVINEMAPRVHNSGHYTIEACLCSQFENHIRAILGWPLGSAALRAPAAAMVNLLGEGEGPALPTGLDAALAVPGAHLHLYGKDRAMKGRKMGHVTALGPTPAEALALAQRAARAMRFG